MNLVSDRTALYFPHALNSSWAQKYPIYFQTNNFLTFFLLLVFLRSLAWKNKTKYIFACKLISSMMFSDGAILSAS